MLSHRDRAGGGSEGLVRGQGGWPGRLAHGSPFLGNLKVGVLGQDGGLPAVDRSRVRLPQAGKLGSPGS